MSCGIHTVTPWPLQVGHFLTSPPLAPVPRQCEHTTLREILSCLVLPEYSSSKVTAKSMRTSGPRFPPAHNTTQRSHRLPFAPMQQRLRSAAQRGVCTLLLAEQIAEQTLIGLRLSLILLVLFLITAH